MSDVASCSTCGLEVPAGARFCANCGDPVVAAVEPREEIAAELAPGTRLDERYEVVRALGRGGMGVVYLARDQDRDGSLVALKLLPAELTADPHGLALLKQEASVAMRLSHPNVVRLHNLEGRTRKYLTMEYVDGGSLADLVMARIRGQLPRPPGWTGAGLSPAEVVPLLDGIAAGLDFAHSERVIHRDMKPANVLLKRRGDSVVPKVADFGIAREIREMVSRVTQNVIAGTPSYMSPEHYRGEKLDARADVYSTAATVYTLLAARPPFKGGELSWQILNKTPDAIHGVPPGVLAVVQRGMSKDMRGRPDSCGALAAEFREAVRSAVADRGDGATIEPDLATTAGPPEVTADAPPPVTPVARTDPPTTRPAEVEPADEATSKPPEFDLRKTDQTPVLPAPVEPTTPVAGSRAGMRVAQVLGCVLVGWIALHAPALVRLRTEPASPSPKPPREETIGDMVNERRLGQADETLRKRITLTDADVNDGLGLGRTFFRTGNGRAGQEAWDFVVSKRLDAIAQLEQVASKSFEARESGGREALQAAATVVAKYDSGNLWAHHVTARLAGRPDNSDTLEQARAAWRRGDPAFTIAILRTIPTDPATDPEAAVLLCAAYAATPEHAAEAGPLFNALPPVTTLTDMLIVIAYHGAAVKLGRWQSALEAAERWRYLDEHSGEAYEACAVASEQVGNHTAAETYRKMAYFNARKTPPAPKLGR